MGKSLSSSLKWEPFADLFWLSALHMHINCISWFMEEGWTYLCIFVIVCFTLFTTQKEKESALLVFLYMYIITLWWNLRTVQQTKGKGQHSSVNNIKSSASQKSRLDLSSPLKSHPLASTPGSNRPCDSISAGQNAIDIYGPPNKESLVFFILSLLPSSSPAFINFLPLVPKISV